MNPPSEETELKKKKRKLKSELKRQLKDEGHLTNLLSFT